MKNQDFTTSFTVDHSPVQNLHEPAFRAVRRTPAEWVTGSTITVPPT
jgi:hypothetical protein